MIKDPREGTRERKVWLRGVTSLSRERWGELRSILEDKIRNEWIRMNFLRKKKTKKQ
jgi:hypothetical protein